MSLTFRNATPDDAAALAELGARSFTETFGHLYSPDDLALFLENHTAERWREDLLDPEFIIHVGDDDGQLVAYAKVGPPSLPFEPRGDPVELRQFYVLARYHGGGAARALMDWVIATAREWGNELYLSVFVDNHRARRFYQRYGFEAVGRYDFMVGTHADEDIVMRLVL